MRSPTSFISINMSVHNLLHHHKHRWTVQHPTAKTQYFHISAPKTCKKKKEGRKEEKEGWNFDAKTIKVH